MKRTIGYDPIYKGSSIVVSADLLKSICSDAKYKKEMSNGVRDFIDGQYKCPIKWGLHTIGGMVAMYVRENYDIPDYIAFVGRLGNEIVVYSGDISQITHGERSSFWVVFDTNFLGENLFLVLLETGAISSSEYTELRLRGLIDGFI